LSFGDAACAALAVAGRSASGRITIPLPSTDRTNTSCSPSCSVSVGLIGRAGAVGVKGLEIDRRAQRQLLGLALTQLQSGPFADLSGRFVKRPPR